MERPKYMATYYQKNKGKILQHMREYHLRPEVMGHRKDYSRKYRQSVKSKQYNQTRGKQLRAERIDKNALWVANYKAERECFVCGMP